MTDVAAAAPVRLDVATARQMLSSADQGPLLGSEIGVVLHRGPAIHQDVEITLGRPTSVDETTLWPIAWFPRGHTSLLPGFAGTLSLQPDGDDASTVTVSGSYHPPLGLIGAIVDGAIGRRVAEVSVEGLVQGMARRIERGAAQRPASTRG